MKKTITLLVIWFACMPPAHAKIEKLSVRCASGLCLHWWPKLQAAKAWHHDHNNSIRYSVNAQVPDGSTFANAESVIYAKALYRPRIPETESLEALITDDRKEFLSRDPQTLVTEVTPLTTVDGKKLQSFTFFSAQQGTWEQVSYGEESEYYLIFTLSARSQDGFLHALDTYKELVIRYKE